MARMHLGVKYVTPAAIDKWKQERGYDKPLLINHDEDGLTKFTGTIFLKNHWQCLSLSLDMQMMGVILPMKLSREWYQVWQ